jgi:hypothetical protein
MEYRHKLSAWLGNVPGRNELSEHLRIVKSNNLKLRLVLAHPTSPADAERAGKVPDESSIPKTFSVKKDAFGTLAEFDNDNIRIVFARAT